MDFQDNEQGQLNESESDEIVNEEHDNAGEDLDQVHSDRELSEEDTEDEYETADEEEDDNGGVGGGVPLDANGEEPNERDNQPLYDGAPITFRESLVAILTFAMCHRLTGVCINDLLSLIALHCRPNNLCLKTLSKFREYFSMIGTKIIVRHHYCSVCQVPLQDSKSVCGVDASHDVLFFIEMPIEDQIQTMLKRPGFLELLQHRFRREKQSPLNIEDIYDGEIYKKCFHDGFLSNPNNVSFFMYFDGVSLFKSSRFSLWPIYYSINELRYEDRTKKENILLAGLWFGPKPNVNLLLKPLYDKMLKLETNGVYLSLPNGQNIVVKAKVLGAVGDLPAKAAFMRFTHFNGMYSCFYCLSSGGRHEVGDGNTTVQVFPYSRDMVLRTSAETVDPDASVYGVKGPSMLSHILPDFIPCMGIDLMHGTFLGQMRALMSFWFDSSFSTFPFSIRQYTDIVDARLKSIRPPFSFQRLPRALKDLPLYKAYDYKVFMFYYSLPVLLDILPVNYWVHHSIFVTAISILSQESISPDQLNYVDDMLHKYVSDFQTLYGVRYLGLNVHQLLHLVSCVRSLGPAYVYSCFFYESVNGQLARLVHGTRHTALQICSSVTALLNLPTMVNFMNDNEAKVLCRKFLLTGKQRVKIVEIVNQNTFVVGVYSPCHPTPRRISALLQESFNIVGGRCKYFHRLKKKSVMFCSEKYVRSSKKTSCFAAVVHNGVPYLCKILSFLKWFSCDFACPPQCEQCLKMFFCLVRVYERVPWEIMEHGIPVGYLNKVTPSRDVKLFLVEDLKSVCVYVSVDGNEYLCTPVNSLEVE
ncbi:hypothetical protein ONE63_000555 [Megalurothrips usitatus]|uniref:Uncharacterized protein n=1 Tax=Megalurothrips usitatus TaxID=439358 RepID=A0AAV7XZW4_9NEOP|nr:hypothetical protein ONE63_000555 [Megalurothrips usitatus]